MKYSQNPVTFYRDLKKKVEATQEIDYQKFVTALFKDMGTLEACQMHAAIGVSGEAGELIDAVKKTWIYGKPLDLWNVMEELGDLRFYYEAMLQIHSVTDEEVKAVNMMKLKARYPEGKYSDFHAQARLDKDGKD